MNILLVSCLVLNLIPFNLAHSYCGVYEVGIDFKGHDITFTYDAKTAAECSKLCSLLSEVCDGFTFWQDSKSACFLKSLTTQPTRYPSRGRNLSF